MPRRVEQPLPSLERDEEADMSPRLTRSLTITYALSLALLLWQGAVSYFIFDRFRGALGSQPQLLREASGALALALPASLLGSCLVLYLLVRRLRGEVARRAEAEDNAALLLESVREGLAERREHQERLRLQGAALEAAAHSILIVDREGKILWVNDAFTRLTGYPAREALGQNPYQLLCGRPDALQLQELVTAIAGGSPWHGELVTRRKDGTLYDEEVTITPVLDERGELTHCIGIMQDVTERKRAEQAQLKSNLALEEANGQLVQAIERAEELALRAERANAAKSEFLANMSHEIRTPMNAIVGVSHLLADTLLSAQQTEHLHTLTMSAELLLRTIDDVLDFSKIEAGKLQIERVEFSAREVIDQVLSVLEVSAREKGLQLHCEVDRELPPCLMGDPLRLAQILSNLLRNAVKFTRHGFVQLSVAVARRSIGSVQLEFSVRDTGIGIRAEDQAQLFRSFSQVDGSMTRRYGGTGLGLVICKRLVELMGGEIWCESVPALGSTFSFRLPMAVAAADHAAPSRLRLPAREAHFNGERILLVEDNSFNQQVALALLEKGGLQVTLAANGAEALELIYWHPFDLVLMDVQMPVMDGLTATREIRKLTSPGAATLPIIAVSANATEDDVRASLAAGMNAHITKPFSPDFLYRTIGFWIAARKGTAGQGDEVAAERCAPEAQARPGEGKIDIEKGIRQTGGNRELYRDLLERFELEYGSKGEEIRRELADGKLQQASHLAHSVKGIAGVLAATPLQCAAQRLESALKNGSQGVERFMVEFEEELAGTMSCLSGELASSRQLSGGAAD